MTQHNGVDASLAAVALVCAVLAFPLWLLSFSWVPFAVAGRPLGSVRYVIVAAEAGALLAALLAPGSVSSHEDVRKLGLRGGELHGRL